MRIAITIVALVVCMLGYGQKRKGAGKKPTQSSKVRSIPEIVVEEEMFSFSVVDEKPMFEACKDVDKQEQTKCFKEQLNTHVIAHFHYPEAAVKAGIQGSVRLVFRVNPDGSVTIVELRGPHPLLEQEVRHIIEALPKFIPGKLYGKPVPVIFDYPISFRLQSPEVKDE